MQSGPTTSNYLDEPSQKKIVLNQDRQKSDEKIEANFSCNSIDALLNQALAGRERILGQSTQRAG